MLCQIKIVFIILFAENLLLKEAQYYQTTQIKVQKLSEMLCTVENMKSIKESHILSLLRYFDLIRELKEMH